MGDGRDAKQSRMITANRPSPASDGTTPLMARRHWQALWREAITDPIVLLRTLGLEHRAAQLLPPRDTGFALRVPRGFVARMRHGDAADPLLLQALPQAAELLESAGFVTDPVGDAAAKTADGVIHKYQGRTLLIATGSCAINCRYCFRRHFPYAEETASTAGWHSALEHLRSDDSINEVILSGGDPLSLSTAKLADLGTTLVAIPHVRRLRIHTRLPIVLPERVDAELIDWLTELPLQKTLVLHANHGNEFDDNVRDACSRLRAANVVLLNQSVLLRGINDNVDALADLSEALIDAAVVPYYLHQLDRVQGAAHFAVADEVAVALVESLRQRLPGYLVPRLVREIAGQASKTPL